MKEERKGSCGPEGPRKGAVTCALYFRTEKEKNGLEAGFPGANMPPRRLCGTDVFGKSGEERLTEQGEGGGEKAATEGARETLART